MAVLSGGLLGSSRKKVGSIVTYRLKGQDVARSKAASISNPRTRAQMVQRVRLANLVSFYRLNQPWMDGLAFSARPQRWSDYNAFVSANFAGNRVALTKTEAANGTCIVAPYRVSEGNLSTISVNRVSDGQFATNLYVGDVNPATATVAEVTSALLANNNGMYEGMQLSLIVNYQQQVGGVYRAIVRYYEVILSLTDTRTFASLMSDTHIAAVNQSIGFTAGDNDPVMGFAFILSVDEGGKTRTSTQYLTLTDDSIYNTYTTEPALTAAIQSYGGGMVNAFLSAGYQTSSQGAVLIPTSILSVNGKTAGSYFGSVQVGSQPALRVKFNENVTGEASSTIKVLWDNGTQTYPEGTGSGHVATTIEDGEVHINTDGIGSANGGKLEEITVQLNGIGYNIKFETSDITEGGDVTQ